eukprot:TRINITY_DN5915_c0_g1_i2.p1 TRINITY_DN5915_c0_g1~~TRINITY_DN5915_c0_g1_i2.p1  ORF type:complete len:232 (+),score=49.59 TRINITY_DN5915_c0_g1_i2:114-809(+)
MSCHALCWINLVLSCRTVVATLDVANLEHAATAALADMSSSPAPAAHHATSAKRRSKPARQTTHSKAPHIMTSFDKDLNLAAITKDTTLYQACRSWMHSDTNGELLQPTIKSPTNNPVVLPMPDPTVHLPEAWAQASLARQHDAEAALDDLFDEDADKDTEIDIHALFQAQRQSWKQALQTRHRDYNRIRARRYRASLAVLHADGAPVVAAHPQVPDQSRNDTLEGQVANA